MKFARRRDDNEREIIDALVAIGAAVEQLNGDGTPDLLVSWRGQLWLIEVKLVHREHGRRRAMKGKHDDSDPRYRELTPSQVRWWREWKGKPPAIVHNVDEARAAIGATIEEGRSA